MSVAPYSLVLRLAAPLQSWGGQSQFNRRDTLAEPTKGGIVGLLAAALGRRRTDPIADLLALRLGVRVDQPGSVLRDYHTASDHRGRPLPSAQVNAKGMQKLTAPAKPTHVTQRFYLQDAVFTAAVSGPSDLLSAMADAVRRPAFPLALGRRACPPTQPLLFTPETAGPLWPGDVVAVLGALPWQASEAAREGLRREARLDKRPVPGVVDLPMTVDCLPGDEPAGGEDVRVDVPVTFDPLHRGYTTRRVFHAWARNVPTGFKDAGADRSADHDPFALLGW